MSRRCALTGKGVLFGNNVSHSNRKTRRRWLPNLRQTSLMSDALGQPVNLRVCTRVIHAVDKVGIDAYLLNACDSNLSQEARRWKKRIQQRLEKTKAAA